MIIIGPQNITRVKLEKKISTIVQGVSDTTFATIIEALRSGPRTVHPDHFIYLDQLRNGNKRSSTNKKFSQDYQCRIHNNRYKLYHYVCRALVQIDGAETPGRLLRHPLEIAQCLLFRGHPDLALEWIDEAKKRAAVASDHLLLIECLDLERIVLKDIRGTDPQREANRSAIRAALQTLQTVADLRLLADEMLDIARRASNNPNSPLRKRADEIMAHPLVVQSESANSFKAKSNRFSILSVYNRWVNKLPEALEAANAHLALWDLHPEMVKHMPQAYISAVSNAFSFSLLLDKNTSWAEYQNRLNNPALRSKALKAELYRATELNYLLHRLKNGMYHEVTADRDRLINTMDELGRHLQPSFVITMNWNLAFHALLTNELRIAQRHFNRIVEGRHDPAKPEILALACAFETLVKAERQTLTPDDLVRLGKIHNASGGQNEVSLAVFAQLKALAENNSPKNLRSAQSNLWSLLVNFEPKKRPSGHDDLALWMYTRLSGQTMAKVLEENLHLKALANKADNPFAKDGPGHETPNEV